MRSRKFLDESLLTFSKKYMPSLSESSLFSRKRKKMFSLKLLKMKKVKASGNLIRDIPCPSPRSGHRIIYANGNIYSFGGYNPTIIDDRVVHTLYKELLVFNCVSKTWRLLETTGDVPEEVASHCAAYFQNQLFIFGGTAYPFGVKVSNDVYVCNLKTLHWSKIEASGCPPSPQYGQAVAVCENKMYCVGGTSGYIYSNEVHCFDLITKEWKQLSKKNEEPNVYKLEPRYRHEIAIYDKKIFVFGGSSLVNFGLQELPVFDLQSNNWSKVATTGSYPSPRRAHACVQSESDIILMGGFNGDTGGYNSIYKINLIALQWEKLPVSLPYRLYFHSAALTDANQLYIFGGMNGEEGKRTNDIHSMWLKIPSLKAMCWEAVLHYSPHLAQLEKRTLFEIGIPINYLNEIEHYSLSDIEVVSDLIYNSFQDCDTDSSDDSENAEFPSDHSEDEDFEILLPNLDWGAENEELLNAPDEDSDFEASISDEDQEAENAEFFDGLDENSDFEVDEYQEAENAEPFDDYNEGEDLILDEVWEDANPVFLDDPDYGLGLEHDHDEGLDMEHDHDEGLDMEDDHDEGLDIIYDDDDADIDDEDWEDL